MGDAPDDERRAHRARVVGRHRSRSTQASGRRWRRGCCVVLAVQGPGDGVGFVAVEDRRRWFPRPVPTPLGCVKRSAHDHRRNCHCRTARGWLHRAARAAIGAATKRGGHRRLRDGAHHHRPHASARRLRPRLDGVALRRASVGHHGVTGCIRRSLRHRRGNRRARWRAAVSDRGIGDSTGVHDVRRLGHRRRRTHYVTHGRGHEHRRASRRSVGAGRARADHRLGSLLVPQPLLGPTVRHGVSRDHRRHRGQRRIRSDLRHAQGRSTGARRRGRRARSRPAPTLPITLVFPPADPGGRIVWEIFASEGFHSYRLELPVPRLGEGVPVETTATTAPARSRRADVTPRSCAAGSAPPVARRRCRAAGRARRRSGGVRPSAVHPEPCERTGVREHLYRPRQPKGCHQRGNAPARSRLFGPALRPRSLATRRRGFSGSAQYARLP